MQLVPTPGLTVSSAATLSGQRQYSLQRLLPATLDFVQLRILFQILAQHRVNRAVLFQCANTRPLEYLIANAAIPGVLIYKEFFRIIPNATKIIYYMF